MAVSALSCMEAVYLTGRTSRVASATPCEPKRRNKPRASVSILQSIATGNEAAVAECLSHYGGLVWSMAKRFCGNQTEAEDAVQEIFTAVWQNAGKYNPDIAAESTFIAVIARRRLIDRRRRLGSRVQPETMVAEPPAVQRSAEQLAVLGDEARVAHEMLATLPEHEVQVLRMSVMDGMTHSEIAEQTGIALGTVKTHIRRGLQKLRDKLVGRSKGGAV